MGNYSYAYNVGISVQLRVGILTWGLKWYRGNWGGILGLFVAPFRGAHLGVPIGG